MRYWTSIPVTKSKRALTGRGGGEANRTNPRSRCVSAPRVCWRKHERNSRRAMSVWPIVTHGDFGLLFLLRFHPLPLVLFFNASVTNVHVTPDTTQLVEFNSVAHLPDQILSW